MRVDRLDVKISESRSEMGRTAAFDIHERILTLLTQKPEINIVFAAAPSQNEVLEQLITFDDIEWSRISAYHMDEYIGLSDEYSDKSFGYFLDQHIFSKVPFKCIHHINGKADNPKMECERYAQLLKSNPTDIVIMGVGENGHIAFNDPWVADFEDTEAVKVVELDETCRMQQVNDGCFDTIDDVPTHAITLTCPTLFSGKNLFCVVPAKTKAQAVLRTLYGDISETCPATILRKHESAVLYLDRDSSSLIENENR